ncbi:intron transferasE [Caudoviricetes sp.]|nr:intron transferasE [Caudoviricetes sp.]
MNSVDEAVHGISRYSSKKYRCRCDVCKKAAVDYQRNRRALRPDVREQNKLNNRKNRIAVYKHVQKLKDKPCTDCGVRYPYYVMHFDHLDAKQKSAGISQLRTIALIDIEVKKCELVCANCHAERTHKRRLDNIG